VPAQTIFFVGDKLHASQTAASIYGVSSTANGYNRESVRDTSWLGAWKPADGSSDEYIQVDGGSATWIGAAGATAHVAIAYDARGCDQNTILLKQDTADAPGGTFATLRDTFTLNKTAPTVDYLSFLVSTSGRQYYRLTQANADRGGGTKTVPIYAAAFFSASQVFIMDTQYLGNSPAPGDYTRGSNVGIGETTGGMWQTNRNGPAFQEFDVNIDRATTALWDALDAHFEGWHDGPGRAYWLQYDGIKNAAKSHFGMVHQLGFQATRPLKEQYTTRMRYRTCGKPL